MTFRDDWEPLSDYDDQMSAVQSGYLSYDDTHCKHGTFVGGWAGPDYLCFKCEMGEPEPTAEEIEADRREERFQARLRKRKPALIDQLNKLVRLYEASGDDRYLARVARVFQWSMGYRIPHWMRPSQGLRPQETSWYAPDSWGAGPNTPLCYPCKSVPPAPATSYDRPSDTWYCHQCRMDIYCD